MGDGVSLPIGLLLSLAVVPVLSVLRKSVEVSPTPIVGIVGAVGRFVGCLLGCDVVGDSVGSCVGG